MEVIYHIYRAMMSPISYLSVIILSKSTVFSMECFLDYFGHHCMKQADVLSSPVIAGKYPGEYLFPDVDNLYGTTRQFGEEGNFRPRRHGSE